MHDIDIAHAGAYSLYIEGIRRTDRLCAELWKTIQNEPEYAGGRHYSFFRTLGATRTMMRAGTDFNIIALATLPLGLLG